MLLLLAGCVSVLTTQDCEVCPELVLVPPGQFLMGSTPAETQAHEVKDEHAIVEWPQHRVAIAPIVRELSPTPQ